MENAVVGFVAVYLLGGSRWLSGVLQKNDAARVALLASGHQWPDDFAWPLIRSERPSAAASGSLRNWASLPASRYHANSRILLIDTETKCMATNTSPVLKVPK